MAICGVARILRHCGVREVRLAPQDFSSLRSETPAFGWVPGIVRLASGHFLPASLRVFFDTLMSGKRISGNRGSILLVTLFVMSFLSILLFTATGTLLLAHKAQMAFERWIDLFYVAEAGLAHAQAVCARGEAGMPRQTEEGTLDSPWDQWVPFGGGAYLLKAYHPVDPHPEVSLPYEKGGMLVEVEARMEPHLRTRIFAVLNDPPSCAMSAWWQEREM